MISTWLIQIVSFSSCFCFLFTFWYFVSTMVSGYFCLSSVVRKFWNYIETQFVLIVRILKVDKWYLYGLTFKWSLFRGIMMLTTSTMEFIMTFINNWKLLTKVTRSSILDVVWGPKYTIAIMDAVNAVNLHTVFSYYCCVSFLLYCYSYLLL